MGGAIKSLFISAHFLLSAYILTARAYRRMRLATRVYSGFVKACTQKPSGELSILCYICACVRDLRAGGDWKSFDPRQIFPSISGLGR